MIPFRAEKLGGGEKSKHSILETLYIDNRNPRELGVSNQKM